MGIPLLALLFSAFSLAQMVGQPGVSYNGKLGENDLCLRPDHPAPSCTSAHPAVYPARVEIQEEAGFRQNCHPWFQRVSDIGAAITAKKKICEAQNAQAAQFMADQSVGAAASAFGATKDISDSVGNSLGECSATLLAHRQTLEGIRAKVRDRIRSIEYGARQFATNTSEASDPCDAQISLGKMQNLTDLDARYKLGFLKLIEQEQAEAGLAAGDYSRAQAKLAKFFLGAGLKQTAMDSLSDQAKKPSAMDALRALSGKKK